MSIEVMRQALEALEMLARYENPETRIQVRKPKDGGPIVTMYPHKVAFDAAADLRTAIEQADPILWYHSVSGRVRFDGAGLGRNWVPLYTAPQSINDFKPDWDTVKAYDEKFAEMLDEQQRLRAELKRTEQRLHDVATLCANVEGVLKAVNTAAMKLTAELTCMEVDDDDRLDRDRVMERVMRWRNEWDKAMFEYKPKAAPRQWVGLTTQEIEDEWERVTGHSIFAGDRSAGRSMFLSPDEVIHYTQAIEAKLKAINT